MGSICLLRKLGALFGNHRAKCAFTALSTYTKPFGISLHQEDPLQVNNWTVKTQTGLKNNDIHVRGLKRMYVPSPQENNNKKLYVHITTIQRIQKSLQLTLREAGRLLSLYPELKEIKPKQSSTVIEYLVSKGFDLQQLKDNPWLLTCTVEELDSKLSFVESELGNPATQNELIFLLSSPQNQVEKIVIKLRCELTSGVNRLHYLKQQLEASGPELSHILYRHFRISNMVFEHLKSRMSFLKMNGFTAEDIRRDINKLSYSAGFVENELKKLRDFGVNPVHLWMIGCTHEKRRRFVKKIKSYRDVLKDHKDVVGYLAERLEKPVELIDRRMVRRHPRLNTVNPPKVKQILDLLFSRGYGSEQIMSHPRIFRLSVKKIEERLDGLRDLGCSLVDLVVLYKTKKKFEIFVNRLKHKNVK